MSKFCLKKLNNRGVSLVELVVSVTILVLAGTAILHSIVTGVRVNAKSHEQQVLTMEAQSIMEGFKAYSVENLKEQFDPTVTEPMHVISNSTGTTGYTTTATDTYEFTMRNIDCEGKKYDAVIDVSPLQDASAHISGSISYVNVNQLNEYTDAIYVDDDPLRDNRAYEEVMKTVCAELNVLDTYEEGWDDQNFFVYNGDTSELDALHQSANIIELDTSKIKIDKYTTIDVKQDNSNDKLYIVTIKVEYKYSTVSGLKYRDEYNNAHDYTRTNITLGTPLEKTIYNNAVTYAENPAATLKNVYIFFYPAYSDLGAKINSETFTATINKNLTNKIKMWLYKQVNPSLSKATINTCELSYYSPVIWSYIGSQKKDTAFDWNWNFCDNLGGGTSVHNYRFNNANQVKPEHNYHKCLGDITVSPSAKSTILNYNVSVKLYAPAADDSLIGTTELLYTLNGTKID